MIYAEKIRRLRGISKSQLARSTATNQATMSRLLNERIPMSPTYTQRLAAALGIDPARVAEQVTGDE